MFAVIEQSYQGDESFIYLLLEEPVVDKETGYTMIRDYMKVLSKDYPVDYPESVFEFDFENFIVRENGAVMLKLFVLELKDE